MVPRVVDNNSLGRASEEDVLMMRVLRKEGMWMKRRCTARSGRRRVKG